MVLQNQNRKFGFKNNLFKQVFFVFLFKKLFLKIPCQVPLFL